MNLLTTPIWALFLTILILPSPSTAQQQDLSLSSYLTGTLNAPNVSTTPQALFDSVWARVLPAINTECKSCPYPLCTNRDWFASSYQFRASCWIAGAKVGDNEVWLRSLSQSPVPGTGTGTGTGKQVPCYVAEFDTLKYWRSYIKDIPQCPGGGGEGGREGSVRRVKTEVKEMATCKMCPHETCEVIGEYAAGASVRVTCHAKSVRSECLEYCPKADWGTEGGNESGEWEVGNGGEERMNGTGSTSEPLWYRTVHNCYILASTVPDLKQASLESCGPVPFLKKEFRIHTSLVITSTLVSSSVPAVPVQSSVETLSIPARPKIERSVDLPARPMVSRYTTSTTSTFSTTWSLFPGASSAIGDDQLVPTSMSTSQNLPKLTTSHHTITPTPTSTSLITNTSIILDT